MGSCTHGKEKTRHCRPSSSWRTKASHERIGPCLNFVPINLLFAFSPLPFPSLADVVPVDPSSVDEWEHEPFSGYVDLEKELVYGRGASDDKGEHLQTMYELEVVHRLNLDVTVPALWFLITASLVSLLASFSSLLASGFEPQRTLVLSFGFDEEASGTQGARQLAKRLEEVYGSHREGRGAYMIVDEGSGIDADLYGLTVAGPAVAEKGYIDVRITVKTPGGHSSDPPQHTSIGILSRVIAAIEDRPWTPTMGIREDDPRYTEGSAERADALDAPGLETLLCLHDAPKIQSTPVGKALHEFITARKRLAHVRSTVARNILASLSKQWLLKRELRRLYRARYQLLAVVVDSGEFKTFATTQAVDIISGGVKINALPEKATAVINHRINAEQSVEDVRQHLRAIIKPVVHKLGLTVDAWGETASTLDSSCAPTSAFHSERNAKGKGTVVVEDAFDSPLESAPRTPTHGKGAGPYRLLSSVIRSSWQLDDPRYPLGASNQTQSAGQRSYFKDEERLVRVAPTLMEGNTDTHSYWNLTQHIFRFSPNTLAPMRDGNIPDDGNIHTVNEAVHIDTLVAGFEFYTALMVAAQDGAQIHS